MNPSSGSSLTGPAPVTPPKSPPAVVPVRILGPSVAPSKGLPIVPPKSSISASSVPKSSVQRRLLEERRQEVDKSILSAPWRKEADSQAKAVADSSKPVATLEKNKGLAHPKLLPKGAVRAPGLAPTDPKAPVPTLSDPLVDFTNRDPPILATATSSVDDRQVRVSLDYSGALNVVSAGRSETDSVHPSCREEIRHFLLQSRAHRVGICSYIGVSGPKSQQRRDHLPQQVQYLNRWLLSERVPQEQLVGLHITSDQSKPIVRGTVCSTHLDDKWTVIEQASQRGTQGHWFTRRGWDGVVTFEKVSDFFTAKQLSLTPKLFAEPFYPVP